jgi:hypothetical protein
VGVGAIVQSRAAGSDVDDVVDDSECPIVFCRAIPGGRDDERTRDVIQLAGEHVLRP